MPFFSVLSNSKVFENGKAVMLCICLSGISACLKLCLLLPLLCGQLFHAIRTHSVI